MLKRKVISWILMLALMFTSASAVAFADEQSEGVVVMDRTYPCVPGQFTIGGIDTTVAYEGKTSSLSWTFGDYATQGADGFIIKIPYSDAWASGGTFNIRCYCPVPNQQIAYFVNEYETYSWSKDNRYYRTTATIGEGWQVLSVNVDTLKAYWEVEKPEYIYVNFIMWNTTLGTKEEFEAGAVQAIMGEKMYIDSLWIEDASQNHMVLADFGRTVGESAKSVTRFNNGVTFMDRTYPCVPGEFTIGSIDNKVAYEDKASSLSWTFGDYATQGADGFIIKIPYSDAWASGGTFNIRCYCPVPNQQIAYFVNEYETYSWSKDNKYYRTTATIGEGWQVLSVNVDTLKAYWEVEKPDYIYVNFINTWNLILGTKEEFEAGAVNAIKGEKMYIDSLWIEDASQNHIVLADFGNSVNVMDLNNPSKLSHTEYDTSVKYDESSVSSLAWTFGDYDGIVIQLPYDGAWNYDKLKFRLKTDIPDQTFNMIINENHYFGSQSTGDTYLQRQVKTTGDWQEFSVDVETMKTKWQNENPEYVYIYLDTKWSVAKAVEKENFDSTQMQAIIGEKLYIDEIWLEDIFGVVSFETNEAGTNATATLKMHRAEPLVLVAAVYEGNELAYVITADSEENFQSLTLKEDLTLENGQTVKFMLWDSLEGMKPYTAAK